LTLTPQPLNYRFQQLFQTGMSHIMETMSSSAFADLANNAKAWPFIEAKLLIERLEKMGGKTGPESEVIFETGYGPSGLPHIGTFGEVVRTSMVRHAYHINWQTHAADLFFG
jgi:hypothetical protein